MNEAYRIFWKVVSLTNGMNNIPESDFEIEASRDMFDLEKGSFRFILSNKAQTIVDENQLGDFSVRFDEVKNALMIMAPSDHARTIFRLAF